MSKARARRQSAPSALFLVLALVAGACAPAEGGDDAGVSDPARCAPDDPLCDPYDDVHFLGTWSDAVCRFLLDCCLASDRLAALSVVVGEENVPGLLLKEPELFSDHESCVDAIHFGLSARLLDDVIAYTDDRRSFDREAAEECIGYAELAAYRCAPALLLVPEEELPRVCGELFPAAVPPGERCYGSDDCRDGDDGEARVCLSSSEGADGGVRRTLTGTCQAVPAEGERCEGDETACEAGLYCDPESLTCQARAAIGESCAGRACSLGGFCDDGTFSCAATRANDEACASDEQCASERCDDVLHRCVGRERANLLTAEFDYCVEGGGAGTLRDLLPVSLVDPFLADISARFALSALQTAALLVEEDASCGFASDAVSAGAEVTGEVGTSGSAQLGVEACVLEIAEPRDPTDDCRGEGPLVQGAVAVTGTRTLTGLVSGEAAAPIVPVSDDAVALDLSLELSGYEIRLAGITVLFESGRIRGRLSPRLARSLTSGACSVTSPVARLDDVVLEDVAVVIESGLGRDTRTIASAQLSAVAGRWEPDENTLAGHVELGSKRHEVPADEAGLDPFYDPTTFERTWQCHDDVAMPAPHVCPFVPEAGAAVARLSTRALAAVTRLVDEDASCGFASAAVTAGASIAGEVGSDGSVRTLTIAEPCALTLPEPLVVEADCDGGELWLEGALTVSGTKTLRGFATGAAAEPLVPTSEDAARFDLVIAPAGLRSGRSDDDAVLTLSGGSLAGSVVPRLARDESSRVCGERTPAARLAFTLDDVTARLEQGDDVAAVQVDSASLEATAGPFAGVENRLRGSVTLLGETVTLAADTALDPDYTRDSFDAALACRDVELVDEPAACSFREVLAEAAARLLVRNVGVAFGISEADDACGFASSGVLSSAELTGASGEVGSATFQVDDCTSGPLPAGTPVGGDCIGGVTEASGSVNASATKVITGLRLDGPPLVAPLSPDAMSVSYAAELTDLDVGYRPPGASAAPLRARVSGALSATLTPLLGESDSNPDVYSVPTPVLRVQGLSMPSAEVTLQLGASTFRVTLSDVALDALVGAYDGQANVLTAELSVDGQPFTLSLPLDPAFEQAAFDATYACTPDLAGPVAAD